MRKHLLTASVGAMVLVSAAAGATAATAPIAHYTFDGNANDSAGAHTGALQNGATIVNSGAKVGTGALQLDGTDDFVSVTGNDGATNFGTLTNNYTIAAWVNPGRLTGVQRVFGNDRSAGANGFGFGLSGANLRHTTFGIRDYNQTGTTVPANAWSHIAVVLDSANTATFYINGTAAGTLTQAAAGNPSTNPFVIGRTTVAASTTPAELYQGLVDDLRVYNTALSAGDVAALAVPEPTGAAAFAAAAAAGLLARRRRRADG